jgi:hypothetical protein
MSKDTAININTITDTLNSLHDELEKRIKTAGMSKEAREKT